MRVDGEEHLGIRLVTSELLIDDPWIASPGPWRVREMRRLLKPDVRLEKNIPSGAAGIGEASPDWSSAMSSGLVIGLYKLDRAFAVVTAGASPLWEMYK